MKERLLELISCPHCAVRFDLEVTERENGEIKTGTLSCGKCGRAYPVTGFIPRILDGYTEPRVAKTAENFGNQWNSFTEMYDFYEEEFLNWMTPLTKKDIEGKIVLDAGCGMGRFLYYASEYNAAEAIGVDLSHAVDAAYQTLRGRENVHLIQADLCNLPFATVFDMFYSIGVIHHTPDPEATFHAICKTLRPGGIGHAWVYGYENNKWVVDFVTPVREAITSKLSLGSLRVLSFFITLFLQSLLKALYFPAGAYNIGFLKRVLPYFPYMYWLSKRNFGHTHGIVHDHLTAPIAFYIKKEDFLKWFEKESFTDVKLYHRNENSWTGVGIKTGK